MTKTKKLIIFIALAICSLMLISGMVFLFVQTTKPEKTEAPGIVDAGSCTVGIDFKTIYGMAGVNQIGMAFNGAVKSDGGSGWHITNFSLPLNTAKGYHGWTVETQTFYFNRYFSLDSIPSRYSSGGSSIVLENSRIQVNNGNSTSGIDLLSSSLGQNYAVNVGSSTGGALFALTLWYGIEYNIDFNGGAVGSKTSCKRTYSTYDQKWVKYDTDLSAVTRTGYTYKGIFDAKTGGNKFFNADGTSTSYLTRTTAVPKCLYAQWEPKTITVTLDPNGGTMPAFDYKLVKYGSTYGILQPPTRTGYTFNGWWTAKTGGTKVTDATKVTNASNHTLYARWRANENIVTYSMQSGSFGYSGKNDATERTFNGTSNFVALGRENMYTNSLYLSVDAYMDDWSVYGQNKQRIISCTEGGGWNIESSGGNICFACYDSGVGYKSVSTSKAWSSLSAGWHTFVLSFDGKYAVGYVDGAKVGQSAKFTSGKIGYHASNSIFLGAEAGANATTPAGSYFKGKIKNVKIYNGSGHKTATYDSTYGTLLTPKRTGYTFAGWWTSATGGTKITSTSKVNITSNQTLYARWTANEYTVTYGLNGGEFGFGGLKRPQTQSFDGSTFVVLGRNDMYTDSLYLSVEAYMDDWSTYGNDSQRIISCTEGGGWNIQADTKANIHFAVYDSGRGYRNVYTSKLWSSLTPGWHTFTLSFDGIYAVGYVDGVKVGQSARFESGKIGYHASNAIFLGAEAGSNATTPAGSYFVGQIRNLYINRGSSHKTVTYNSTYGTLMTPTREGYNFVGWYTSPSGGTKVDSSTKVTATSAHSIYAHWTKLNVLTLDYQGGSASDLASEWTDNGTSATRYCESNVSVGNLPNMSRIGTVFLGWFNAPEGGSEVTSSTMVTSSMTIYARWSDTWALYRSQSLEKSGDVYLVGSAEDLGLIAYEVAANNVEYMNANFVQEADIDLGGHEWFQIGDTTTIFKGSFDGNGYRIINMGAQNIAATYFGLFGTTEGATIKNVSLKLQLNIKSQKNLAGIVGYAKAGTLIENCDVYGSITGYRAAGIASWVENSTISQCENHASIEATTGAYAGGIAVNCVLDSQIMNCYNTATIKGAQAGGICSSARGGAKITGCVNQGEIVSILDDKNPGSPCAGIVADVLKATISNCSNSGSVKGNFIGGIVGDFSRMTEASEVKNCLNTGPLYMLENDIIMVAGGIVGGVGSGSSTLKIIGCYAKCMMHTSSNSLAISAGIVALNNIKVSTNCQVIGCGAEIVATAGKVDAFYGDLTGDGAVKFKGYPVYVDSSFVLVKNDGSSVLTISQSLDTSFDEMFVYDTTNSLLGGYPVPKGIFWVEGSLSSNNVRSRLTDMATEIGATLVEFKNVG